ncbi:MAG: SpoIID/LytB domain-containing protein, partial [Chloroflexota bacterium]
HGTDHGVGLSQRGAAGRAKAGQTYDQILLHYFDSATTYLGKVAPDTTIRALVVKTRAASSTQTALVQGGKITEDGTILERSRWTFDTPGVDGRSFPANWRLVLIGSGARGAWQLEVQDGDGATKARFSDADARLTVTPVQDGTGPAVTRVLIRPDTKYDTYAGTMRIGRVPGGIRVVNVVPIEAFVRSVVPQEMGASNPAEALKAQAVASRSYFLAGRSKGTKFLAYDVESYRVHHSYKGVRSEVPEISDAVDATARVVLRYVDASGSKPIIRAFYHAVGGGATEASMNVFTSSTGKPGTKVAYLMGGPDVDENGEPYDERAPMYEWHTRALTLRQLSKILARDPRTNVGQLTAWPVSTEGSYVERRTAALLADAKDRTPAPENRGTSGRLTWIVLKGERKGKRVEKRVAGWVFEQVFNAHRGSGDPLGSTMIFREKVSD